jgi:uncharacterized protein YbbC (DUF1343 family)
MVFLRSKPPAKSKRPWRRFAGIAWAGALFGLSTLANPAAAESAAVDPVLATASRQIDAIAADEIAAGHVGGAVIVVGQHGKVIYQRAVGQRRKLPQPAAMTLDTIFDLASLTKVVATTTAILQLSEAGRLDLTKPVAAYWPGFGQNGKQAITIADLLTHYSALPPDLPPETVFKDTPSALRAIEAIAPLAEPGTRFVYSDLDFAALGEIVRRVSGQTLDRYSADHIFKPLQMKTTAFAVSPRLKDRVAPADIEGGQLVWGEVQDPMARRMGGVSGHAGLFSTAADLTRFARMVLSQGKLDGRRILTSDTVRRMTQPQGPLGQAALRGYGWDIDSPYSSNFAPAFSTRSFGHTGYTGTALWIDPASDSFLIILTSRLHPDGSGTAKQLQRRIATVVGALVARRTAGTGGTGSGAADHGVLTGIDVLRQYRFAPLTGHRVGLLTNASGRDRDGRRTVDLLLAAPGVKLTALFSPEHGLGSDVDQKVGGAIDARSGLPVYSLYGDDLRPTEQMLQGLDTIVIDLPDVGARFYTYATTMAYMMEAAAAKGIEVYVLDRPDPIAADVVQGPVLDADLTSFTSYLPMPIRHGMTIGELATMFNEVGGIGAKLHVVGLRHYDRRMWFDETGLPWAAPSPNLRNLTEVTLYPGVAMVEGANVSVGRGTPTPFELVGAPWIDGRRLARDLANLKLPGIAVQATDFTPDKEPFAHQLCHGIRFSIKDRNALDSPQLGLALIAALWHQAPDVFKIEATLRMIGAQRVLDALRNGEDLTRITDLWQADLKRFRDQRETYLIYGAGE